MNENSINELKNSCINNNAECSICYENYTDIETIYILENCKHVFCKPCIFKLMDNDKYKQNIQCPLCRTENKNIKHDDIITLPQREFDLLFILNLLDPIYIENNRRNPRYFLNWSGMRVDAQRSTMNILQREIAAINTPHITYSPPITLPSSEQQFTLPASTSQTNAQQQSVPFDHMMNSILIPTPYNQIEHSEHLSSSNWSEDNVETVMSLEPCTRQEAINALNNNNNNIEDAIFELVVQHLN